MPGDNPIEMTVIPPMAMEGACVSPSARAGAPSAREPARKLPR